MDNTPELHDEVVRKAYETVEKLEHDRNAKTITAAQYGYGIDILWSAVAGLVDSEFMTAVELMNEHRQAQTSKLVFLQESTGTVARIINSHDGKLLFTTFPAGQSAKNFTFDYKDEAQPAKVAFDKVRDLAMSLHKKGFSLL